ncbi:hypothetical protein [Microbacterium sp. G2-8]|uniref:hypothetical protein n=1 Tax=Microbacterium sp. G2-8 TaxID=2842454 RepID=UPI001C8B0945|nr:hypothetical protein [Microbacterium sp. G2-8]
MTADIAPHRAPRAKSFRRLPEMWLAGIGVGLAAVLQGGVTLAINSSTRAEFDEVIAPALSAAGIDFASTDDAYEAARTLAAWFGFSLLLMIGLAAVGFFLASRRPRRRSTGWWFLGAALVCLVGTQLLLYPVAFFLFLAAALFAVRSTRQGPST